MRASKRAKPIALHAKELERDELATALRLFLREGGKIQRLKHGDRSEEKTSHSRSKDSVVFGKKLKNIQATKDEQT